MPRYTTMNRTAVLQSIINENERGEEADEENKGAKVGTESQMPGTECVICLEKCEAARP